MVVEVAVPEVLGVHPPPGEGGQALGDCVQDPQGPQDAGEPPGERDDLGVHLDGRQGDPAGERPRHLLDKRLAFLVVRADVPLLQQSIL